MTQAEKKAKAIDLRKQGLLLREIAAEIGVPRSTVHLWINDPDLAKAKARRERYEGTCDTCGGRTEGSGGFKLTRTRCMRCRTWTREAVLLAFEEWGDDHGGVPPRVIDPRTGIEGNRRLPDFSTVKALFGSWNDGLLAAGYALNQDKRPETSDAMVEMVKAGATLADVAQKFGCTATNVRQRIKRRTGKTVRELWQAA